MWQPVTVKVLLLPYTKWQYLRPIWLSGLQCRNSDDLSAVVASSSLQLHSFFPIFAGHGAARKIFNWFLLTKSIHRDTATWDMRASKIWKHFDCPNNNKLIKVYSTYIISNYGIRFCLLFQGINWLYLWKNLDHWPGKAFVIRNSSNYEWSKEVNTE